jgi:hypothetical protein
MPDERGGLIAVEDLGAAGVIQQQFAVKQLQTIIGLAARFS